MTQPDPWKNVGRAYVDFNGITNAAGLSADAAWWLEQLVDEYQSHTSHNETLRHYYDGRVHVSDYGSKADVPNDQTCHWPAKAVDALADRITLERFNCPDGYDRAALDAVLYGSNVVNGYNRHLTPKLSMAVWPRR